MFMFFLTAQLQVEKFFFNFLNKLKKINPRVQNGQFFVNLYLLKMAERSEAKSAKRSFASKFFFV